MHSKVLTIFDDSRKRKEEDWRNGSRGRWRRKTIKENDSNKRPLLLSKSTMLPPCHPVLLNNSKEGPWPILGHLTGSRSQTGICAVQSHLHHIFREGKTVTMGSRFMSRGTVGPKSTRELWGDGILYSLSVIMITHFIHLPESIQLYL